MGIETGPATHEGERRARALARLRLLEGLPPRQAERLTTLAAHVAGDGFAAGLHLLDDDWQHRLAGASAPLVREAVGNSFCIAVVRDSRSLYTTDAPHEPRVAHSTQATGPDPIRTYWGAPLRPSSGPAVGTLCVWHAEPCELDEQQQARLADLAALAAELLDLGVLARELGHDAAHDPLTALPNRVVLSHRVTAALARLQRGLARPVLLLLDLDGFKQVNDSSGHGVGDEVLVSTARRLREAVRQEDVVARLGGDEFAVLLDDLQGPEVLPHLLARLRRVAELPHATSAGEVRCGFSVGVASAEPGELAYELFGRADAGLYANKRPTRRH